MMFGDDMYMEECDLCEKPCLPEYMDGIYCEECSKLLDGGFEDRVFAGAYVAGIED